MINYLILVVIINIVISIDRLLCRKRDFGFLEEMLNLVVRCTIGSLIVYFLPE